MSNSTGPAEGSQQNVPTALDPAALDPAALDVATFKAELDRVYATYSMPPRRPDGGAIAAMYGAAVSSIKYFTTARKVTDAERLRLIAAMCEAVSQFEAEHEHGPNADTVGS